MVGRTEFCGLGVTVSEGVLIPRPETEELVQWIVADVSNGYTSPEPAVLDVGTGSGAIAVVLASLLPLADVGAIDISPVALNIAEANAESNGVDVEFRMADILDPDFVAWTGWSDGAFDIIVSNPPYIPDSDVEAMHGNVTRYEPHEALFVPDNDPLIFYRAIVRLGHKLLKHGGLLYFEIYERAGDDLQRILAAAGYKDITLRKDINGKDRMIRCRKG